MKQVKAKWLAIKIELHWAYILWCRKRGNNLLDKGEPLNSKRMLKLARKIDHHGIIVFAGSVRIALHDIIIAIPRIYSSIIHSKRRPSTMWWASSF